MLWLRPGFSVSQILASAGATITIILGLLLSVIFARLFRSSPSIPVFFVTFFFILLMVDGFKFAQILAVSRARPDLSVLFSRFLIGGHLLGVISLAGAGLYAGSARLQRHGSAIAVVIAVVAILAASVPLDAGSLPDHLVHATGLRASLEVVAAIFAGIAVLNFVYAAIHEWSARRLVAAIAVAAIVAGREVLFYLVNPVAIVVGGALLLAGAILFALQYFREQILG